MMQQKIFLIVTGSILLILGILLLIAASQHEWENKEYKKITGKNAPTNLKNTSNISGIILTVLGVGLLGWGLAVHAGMASGMKK
jgi:uncharacterized membrane protein YidH (DUF202 family)